MGKDIIFTRGGRACLHATGTIPSRVIEVKFIPHRGRKVIYFGGLSVIKV